MGLSPSNLAVIRIRLPTFLRRPYTGLNTYITLKAWDSLPLEGECWDPGGSDNRARERTHVKWPLGIKIK